MYALLTRLVKTKIPCANVYYKVKAEREFLFFRIISLTLWSLSPFLRAGIRNNWTIGTVYCTDREPGKIFNCLLLMVTMWTNRCLDIGTFSSFEVKRMFLFSKVLFSVGHVATWTSEKRSFFSCGVIQKFFLRKFYF